MSQITVTVWEVDPAFSLMSPTSLTRPEDWYSIGHPTGSPAGNHSTEVTGPSTVDLTSYLHSVTLIDRNGDGWIGNGAVDAFVLNGLEFSINTIYRGDGVVVNGQYYQAITFYGVSQYGGTAISLPIAPDGSLMQAFAGTLSATHWSMDSAPYPIPIAELPCFTAGTLIATPQGAVPVEDLVSGDLVLTADAGPQPLIWVTARHLRLSETLRPEALRPIRIPAGCLGARRDLWLSPLHRVLCRDRAGREVLVALRHLRGMAGIGEGEPAGDEVSYYHLVLAHHAVLEAEGVACESFYAGPRAMAMLEAEERAELRRLLPELEKGWPTPARPLFDRLRQVERRLDASSLEVGRAQVLAAAT